jgi:hypothetical protein
MSTIRTNETKSLYSSTAGSSSNKELFVDELSGLEHMRATKEISDADTNPTPTVVIDGMEQMLTGQNQKIDYVCVKETKKIGTGEITTNIEYRVDSRLPIGSGVVVKNSNITEIDWSLFPVRKIETKHVLTFAARTHSLDQINEKVLEAKRRELVTMRGQIKEFARQYIQFFLVQGFREMAMQKGLTDLVRKVNSMNDILEYHRRNCDTEEGQEIVGHMLFGYWDVRKGWEKDLEEKWMRKMNIQYKEITGEPKKGDVSNWNKGSIAKIIMETKETQVKRIRKAGQCKNVKVRKVRKASQFGQKCPRRKTGSFHVESKIDDSSKKEIENVPVFINKNLEEKMKRAAFKGGMSYELFNTFLTNLVTDENDNTDTKRNINEMSESDDSSEDS